jgi:A1 cistron-splicing factor AAR2
MQEPDDAQPDRPLAWVPKGLKKSTSNGSTSGISIKSHDSVRATGTIPFGSLKVHHVDSESSPLRPSDNDLNEGPPPLESLPEDEHFDGAGHDINSQNAGKRLSQRDALAHGMGGGDVVLMLDLPELFMVGVDAFSFMAKHFGGMKDLPRGPHLLWVAHPSGFSTRCGVWIDSTGDDQVHVLQWDKFNEMLSEASRSEARIQANELDAIHAKLVPYGDPSAVNGAAGQMLPSAAETNHHIWRQMTSHISEPVLDRITGQRGGDWFIHTTDRVKGSSRMAAEIELDKRISNPFLHSRELTFAFTQLERTYSLQHTGSERTSEATDATFHVLTALDDIQLDINEDNIIGEFQFAYLVGAQLGNDACIQQWWHMLLKIILRAYTLLVRKPELAAALLRSLAAQLTYDSDWLDTPLLDSGDVHSRDLRLVLTVYKKRLDEIFASNEAFATPQQLDAVTAFSKVEAVVSTTPLEWDLRGENVVKRGLTMMEDGEWVELELSELQDEDETGEYAPEIVDLDEQGRQKDLVSWKD